MGFISRLLEKLKRASKFAATNKSRDPVCGMWATDNIKWKFQGVDYFFCSEYCKTQFVANPGSYVDLKSANKG